MIDILGHIAYSFLIVGTCMAGSNRACGWAIRAVGSAAWMGLGVSMGMSSIWLWSGVFLFIDISAWSKWRRAQLEKKEFWRRVVSERKPINQATDLAWRAMEDEGEV